MKGNRKFIILFCLVFVLYLVAELNRPKPVDWTVTLAASDKNPYGGYVLYHRLEDLFPGVSIRSTDQPVYNNLNDSSKKRSAYLLLSPALELSKNDLEELRLYVHQGNDAFIFSGSFGRLLQDTFHLKTGTRFSIINKDSTSVKLVNPLLKANRNYTFLSNTIDEYFTEIDTSVTTILGTNDRWQPNFVKVHYGRGSFFFHSAPICFSNYFMLHENNATYTANALSYVPADVRLIYWDEYYKPGTKTPVTPLRFILGNPNLLWALRLAMAGLLVYIFFEMKRKQRVIPVIEPLKNSSLDFVRTVSNVYFNQKDNEGIADKKISYFFDFVRQRFYLQTQDTGPGFVESLAKKSAVATHQVEGLMRTIKEVQNSHQVSDGLLLSLNQQVDQFYKQVLI